MGKAIVCGLLVVLALGASSWAETLASKKFAGMDLYDATRLAMAPGCTETKTEILNFPKRYAQIISCKDSSGFPPWLSIVVRLEITDKSKTGMTLSWTAPAFGNGAGSDSNSAEHAARRVLEAVGIEDADAVNSIVTDFLRPVPMTGDSYWNEFHVGGRRVLVSRESCGAPQKDKECHSLGIDDGH
jgi:hypothetical protein